MDKYVDGPQTSLCISSKGMTLLVIDSENGSFLNLPSKQDSQTMALELATSDAR